jgi:hypothetical protein
MEYKGFVANDPKMEYSQKNWGIVLQFNILSEA